MADGMNAATNAGLIGIQIEYRAVSELLLDARNPRRHSRRQISRLADSIREFGFVMPVVTDEQGQVIVGNGRVFAARKLGMPRIPVVEIRHLSPAQVKALRIADNRLAEQAHWDERLLGESFIELKQLDPDFDLSMTGFSLAKIDLAIHHLTEASADDTIANSGSGAPVCQIGELWELGNHLLYCGDATSEAAFATLMEDNHADVVFVDPPYDIAATESGDRKSAPGPDELAPEELIRFLTGSCTLLRNRSKDGAIHFVCADWKHINELVVAGREVYSELKDIVVWVKNRAGAGSLYRAQHEFIAVFKSGTARHTSNKPGNGRNRSNVWKYDSASARTHKGNPFELHPTAKPVQLVMDALLDCSNRGDIVLDCFLGSGTTLLAAERTGRICRGIELDPLHADTAIRRWQHLTGRKAARVSDGKCFSDAEANPEQSRD